MVLSCIAAQSQAQSRNRGQRLTQEMINNAIVLETENISITATYATGRSRHFAQKNCRDSINTQIKKIRDRIYSSSYIERVDALNGDIAFECSHIVTVINVTRRSGQKHHATITGRVEGRCVPRSPREQLLMARWRSCVEDPLQSSCYEERFQKDLDKIQPLSEVEHTIINQC